MSMASLVAAFCIALCFDAAEAATATHTAPIRDIAVDRDDRYLVSGSEDKSVRIWELPTGRPLGVINPPAGSGREGSIHAVAISPDGKTVACAGYTGRKTRADQADKTYYDVYVYERENGTLLHTLAVPFLADGLLYSPDGNFLVTTSRGSFESTTTDFGADRIFTTKDYGWAKEALIPNGGAAITLADFDRRGRLLFLQKFGTFVAELKGPDFHESREIPGIPTSVGISPDGSRIAVAFADSTVGVFSGEDLSLLYRPDVKGIGPAEVAFTEEMDLAAASLGTVEWSADGTVLYYSGGRTCVQDACFVRKWSDAGRGAHTDVTLAASRVTRLVALKNGGVAYAAAGPALGVLDREDERRSFFATTEPPVRPTREPPAPAAMHEEPPGTALSDAALAQLRDLHGTVTDLMQQRRYPEALGPARQAAELVEQAGDPPVAAAGQALADLARLQYTLGEYRRVAGESVLTIAEFGKALDLYPRAGPITERAAGAQQQDLAALFEEQGRLLRAMNRYDQAADSFQQAVTLRRNALGPDHPDTARAMSDLAAVRVMKLVSEKRFVEAFPAAHAAVDAAEQRLPPNDPALALALTNLGEVYRAFRASYVDAAVARHERALAIRRQSLGAQHWAVAESLRALGEINVARKRYAAARQAYDEALAIEQQALGTDHPALATFITKVAKLHQSLREHAEAEALYGRVLDLREKEGEANKIAHALEDMGGLYRAMGQPAKAEPLYQRALAIREQNMGPHHVTVGETARSLGTLLRVKGNYAGADPLYQRAVAINGEMGNLFAPWVLRDRAALAAAQDDDRAALSLLSASLAAQAPIFRILFRPDREEEQLRGIQSPHVSGSYWFYLWLVARRFKDDPVAVHQAAELVLRRKGIVFDAQSMVNARRTTLSGDAARTRNELSAARAELSALLLHKPPGMVEAEYREKLALRFEQCSSLERTLDRLAPPMDYDPLDHAVTVEAVAATLREKAALVEFVRIPDFNYPREDFDYPRTEWDASWRYLAFVLRRSGNMSLVDLGSADEVERLADHVFRDMRDPVASEWSEHLKALHARIWAPLGLSASEVDKVMIGPDGALSLVPFAALMDSDGKFLLERYELAYVTTGRDLVERPHSASRTDLLLVANPEFDAAGVTTAHDDGVLRSRDSVGWFERLPGTAREAEETPPLVSGTGERTILVGANATEAAVKTANAPRILHLATHGFFLEDQKLGMPEAEYETPLVRSGLALAGANRAAQTTDGDDGLLTALEISGMDMSATELVVLSACDTGVGEVRSGEGVFGLRRAFALAGVGSLVMSLWRVGDATTAEEMSYFYANLREMDAAGALRQAQLKVLNEMRARSGAEVSPRLWGAFMVQGAFPSHN
jgi:CHAT domain-containing protein/tetratricopeptide (TPR) repeat protein